MKSFISLSSIALATFISGAFAADNSVNVKFLGDTTTYCDMYDISGQFSGIQTTDTIYTGLAYANSLGGNYQVITSIPTHGTAGKNTGDPLTFDAMGSYLNATKWPNSKVQIPTADMYQFAVATVNFNFDTITSDGKVMSGSTAMPDGTANAMSIAWPPKDGENGLIKVSSTCTSSDVSVSGSYQIPTMTYTPKKILKPPVSTSTN